MKDVYLHFISPSRCSRLTNNVAGKTSQRLSAESHSICYISNPKLIVPPSISSPLLFDNFSYSNLPDCIWNKPIYFAPQRMYRLLNVCCCSNKCSQSQQINRIFCATKYGLSSIAFFQGND